MVPIAHCAFLFSMIKYLELSANILTFQPLATTLHVTGVQVFGMAVWAPEKPCRTSVAAIPPWWWGLQF